MNSIEEYQNLVGLLEKALEFYANKENYKASRPVNGEIYSSIELDEGSQARFALSKSKEMIEANRKMQEDYNKLIAASEAIQASEDMTDPKELMKKFKVLGNENENL